MRLGIDSLLAEYRPIILGKRLGLLVHAASVNGGGQSTTRRFCGSDDWQVVALFGPEHGVETKAQDMEPVASGQEARTQIPIYSLYGSDFTSLSPTPAMLKDIDILVVDLQDIGTRYYTYIWTTIFCMKVCAKLGKEVIVCDRPNPLGGVEVEGPGIQPGFESFVGLYSIPVRHGLTIGELAELINRREQIGCKLQVIPMEGWEREWHWPETGLRWINPSPNMRSYHAALLYPGICLLEATNCSEGRGTKAPFEMIGAPYVNSEQLMTRLGGLGLPGITMRAVDFIPTHQKHAGQKCHGIRWRITDPHSFKPYRTGLALIWALYQLYHDKGFAWRTEPYEFVADIPAIDLLTGSAVFREEFIGAPTFVERFAGCQQNRR